MATSLDNAYIIGAANFNSWSQGFDTSGYLRVLPHPDVKVPFKDPFADWQADRPGNYVSSWGPKDSLDVTLRMENLDEIVIDGFGILKTGSGVIPWLGGEATPYQQLRAYNGTIPGPMLITEPGDTLNIRLENNLSDGQITNLHTHGLHVSPMGKGDNVLIAVAPGESWNSTIPIPDDHFIGPDWYHPHLHGLTNEQVSSGLVGSLIVTTPFDLPDLQKFNPKTQPFHFMALSTFGVQQVNRTGSAADPLNKDPNVSLPAGTPLQISDRENGQPVYTLSDAVFMGYNAKPLPYDPSQPLGNPQANLFEYGGGPLAEPVENVIHTVNGQYNPTLDITTGAWNVFTFTNTTSNAFHVIQLVRDDGTKLTPVPVQLVAIDGDASGVVASNRRTVTELPLLSPGQRLSFQYWFDQPGKYYMLSNGTPEIMGENAPTLIGSKGFNDGHLIWGAQVLSTIDVTGAPIPTGPPPEPYNTTVEQANEIDQLVAAAKNGQFDRARTFVWSANLGGAILAPPDAPPTDTSVVTFEGAYKINGEYFSTSFVDSMVPLTMPMLGTKEVWSMRNSSGMSDPTLPPGLDIPLLEWHPFHIHQNDFTVFEINGIPVSDLEGVYLDGVLSDTISLPPTYAPGSPTRKNPYGTPQYNGTVSEIKVLMEFDDFPGSYVNHCHILFHEDAGMMAAVSVILNTQDTWLGLGTAGSNEGRVSLYRASDSKQTLDFFPFGTDFRGPISVAIGDINFKTKASSNANVTDNVTDIAAIQTALADGENHFTVRVFDGKELMVRQQAGRRGVDGLAEKSLIQLGEFVPFANLQPTADTRTAIATGDVNGDGHVDVIVGIGGGGVAPQIEVYSGKDFSLMKRLTPFAADPNFRGAIDVAAGDTNGDNFDDIIISQGRGGNGRVEVYNGLMLEQDSGLDGHQSAAASSLLSFHPYGEDYHGEIQVSSGYVLQRPDVPNGAPTQTYHANITTLAVGEPPHGQQAVKVFTYTSAEHGMNAEGGHGTSGNTSGGHTASNEDAATAGELPENLRLDAEFTTDKPLQDLYGSFADLSGMPRGEPVLFGVDPTGAPTIIHLGAKNLPESLALPAPGSPLGSTSIGNDPHSSPLSGLSPSRTILEASMHVAAETGLQSSPTHF